MAQTHDDFELLLVDNGSSDDSVEICREYAARTDKIRLLSCPVPGVAKARNAGIAAAQGPYITFVDSDDWVEPEFLAAFFRTPLPADTDRFIVIEDLLVDVSEDPATKKKNHLFFGYADAIFTRDTSDVKIAMRQKLLLDGFTAGKLYATEQLRRHAIRFPDEDIMCEDHVFFFRCLLHTDIVIWRGGATITCAGARRHSAPGAIVPVNACRRRKCSKICSQGCCPASVSPKPGISHGFTTCWSS